MIYQAEFDTATTIGRSTRSLSLDVLTSSFSTATTTSSATRSSPEKLMRTITKRFALQLQLYGWLFERAVGTSAKRLEVHTGTGAIVDVPYDGGAAALGKLAEVLAVKLLTDEPYEPVGWSKCKAGCGYADRCWKQAEARQDVSLVMDVDQGLARQLHADGIATFQQLISSFDIQRLSELKRPVGGVQKKVGKKAGAILQNAEVLVSGIERILAPSMISAHGNFVIFDLEGMPPQLRRTRKGVPVGNAGIRR